MINGELYKLKTEKDLPKLIRFFCHKKKEIKLHSGLHMFHLRETKPNIEKEDHFYESPEAIYVYNLKTRGIEYINPKDFEENYELIKEKYITKIWDLLNFKSNINEKRN